MGKTAHFMCTLPQEKAFFSPKGKHSGLSMENGLEGVRKRKEQRRSHCCFPGKRCWGPGPGWLPWGARGDQNLDVYFGEEPRSSSSMGSMWPRGRQKVSGCIQNGWVGRPFISMGTPFIFSWANGTKQVWRRNQKLSLAVPFLDTHTTTHTHTHTHTHFIQDCGMKWLLVNAEDLPHSSNNLNWVSLLKYFWKLGYKNINFGLCLLKKHWKDT